MTERRRSTIGRILVPIDFKSQSRKALDYASDLASDLEADVVVAHVYQIPVYSFPDGTIITPPDVAVELADAAQRNLDKSVDSLRMRGIDVLGVLKNGNPWEEICHLAEEQHADLIVMGTHGRHGLTRAILGSVAENVLRASHVPVLVMH